MDIHLTTQNLTSFFNKRFSKQQTIYLVQEISTSKLLFDELVNIIVRDEKPFSIGPSWVMGYVGIIQPAWFIARFHELLGSLHKKTHPAVYRNIARVLRDINIPTEMEGTVAQKCIEWLEDKNQAIAVKAFSLHTLSKIIDHEPEFCRELKAIIEGILPYASAGLSNAANKLLNKIIRIGY